MNYKEIIAETIKECSHSGYYLDYQVFKCVLRLLKENVDNIPREEDTVIKTVVNNK